MGYYTGEVGEHPFPRNTENISALAIHRGIIEKYQYAESLMILKE